MKMMTIESLSLKLLVLNDNPVQNLAKPAHRYVPTQGFQAQREKFDEVRSPSKIRYEIGGEEKMKG